MPTVKYLAISMLFFLTYFLLVGQKGGMVFISDFKKMEKVYFMAHPSGWDIKYTFSLYYCATAYARGRGWLPRIEYCYCARTSRRSPWGKSHRASSSIVSSVSVDTLANCACASGFARLARLARLLCQHQIFTVHVHLTILYRDRLWVQGLCSSTRAVQVSREHS